MPAWTLPPPHHAMSSFPEGAAHESAPIRVVVVDDAFILRKRLVTMLSTMEGVEIVGEAEDATGAIEVIRQVHPQAVVLDLQIPGGSGLDVLAFIREHLPDTKVIVLTNHSNPFFKQKCLQQGASYFFDKAMEFEKVGYALFEA